MIQRMILPRCEVQLCKGAATNTLRFGSLHGLLEQRRYCSEHTRQYMTVMGIGYLDIQTVQL